jgi:hypothetical protein
VSEALMAVRDADGVRVGVAEGVLLAVGVLVGEGDRVVMDGVTEGVGLCVTCEGEPEGVREGVAEEEGLLEAEGEEVGVTERVGEAVRVTEGVAEVVGVTDRDGEALGDDEGVAELVGEGDLEITETEADAETEGDAARGDTEADASTEARPVMRTIRKL